MSVGSSDKSDRTGSGAPPLAVAVAGGQTEPWIGVLESEGLVDAEMLQTALREAGQDPRGVGEWLVDHGCISQRDLALVQAESHGVHSSTLGSIASIWKTAR